MREHVSNKSSRNSRMELMIDVSLVMVDILVVS